MTFEPSPPLPSYLVALAVGPLEFVPVTGMDIPGNIVTVKGRAAFADVWAALPKVVFSRTLDRVEGDHARLATAPLADEVAGALAAAGDRDVSIGGADLASERV